MLECNKEKILLNKTLEIINTKENKKFDNFDVLVASTILNPSGSETKELGIIRSLVICYKNIDGFSLFFEELIEQQSFDIKGDNLKDTARDIYSNSKNLPYIKAIEKAIFNNSDFKMLDYEKPIAPDIETIDMPEVKAFNPMDKDEAIEDTQDAEKTKAEILAISTESFLTSLISSSKAKETDRNIEENHNNSNTKDEDEFWD